MKLILYILISVVSLQSVAQERLRFVSYNVRNGLGIDNIKDYSRSSNVIKGLCADVVSLQEIDSVTKRSEEVDVVKVYGDLTDMKSFFSKAIDYSGGGYGVGLLSKQVPLDIKRYPLPGREEARTLLLAEYEGFIFCATHFSLTPEDQNLSIELIDSIAKESKKPFFVAGDLNFGLNSKQFERLTNNFKVLTNTELATYPANEPKECIDYILLYKNNNFEVKVIESGVFEAMVESDHRPIFLEIEINKQ